MVGMVAIPFLALLPKLAVEVEGLIMETPQMKRGEMVDQAVAVAHLETNPVEVEQQVKAMMVGLE